METIEKTAITVEATVNAPIEKVWDCWTAPEHITQWCFASADWQAPWAKNDLEAGGRFATRMEAKDGSFGFDFGGVYNEITALAHILYTMDDGRKVEIHFTQQDGAVKVVETFEAENQNSIEMQRMGWQAILDNFKSYTEAA